MKLIKRTYLGQGYVHVFTSDKTGEEIFVPCTKKQYEDLSKVDGIDNKPTLHGHTWANSLGGTDKVDTPTTLLGTNEYCVKPEEIVANIILPGKEIPTYIKLPLGVIDENGVLDETVVNLNDYVDYL